MKTRESKTSRKTKRNEKRKANAFIEYLTLFLILLFSQTIARAAETGYIKLDWCDNATGWGGAHTIIIDTEDYKQGVGCLSSTGDNLVSFWLYLRFQAYYSYLVAFF